MRREAVLPLTLIRARPLASLVRLLVVIAILAGCAYGGAWWLANRVEPVVRDVTFTVPADKFAK